MSTLTSKLCCFLSHQIKSIFHSKLAVFLNSFSLPFLFRFKKFRCCIIKLFFYSDIDDCTVGACKNNGTCQDLVNDFRCTCASGFTGKTCSDGKLCTVVIDLIKKCSRNIQIHRTCLFGYAKAQFRKSTILFVENYSTYFSFNVMLVYAL